MRLTLTPAAGTIMQCTRCGGTGFLNIERLHNWNDPHDPKGCR